ncbi:MAG: YcjX family protein [Proteobacteria bacterium]|nr:YcjX family protein [Pseudomonadota bacterium]
MTDLQRWTDLALAPLKAAGEALVDFPALLTHERRRVAITGLQRSGKTVFITAFAHALVSAKTQPATKALPFFPWIKKVQDVTLHEVPGIPRFDYEGHLAALQATPPRWPEATRTLSAVRIRIRHEPESFLGRRLSSSATTDVDLVDYPGEWLLDLPLLTQSYEEWSRQGEDLAGAPERADLAAAWRADAARIDLDAPEDARLLRRVGGLYVDYLRACRTERALSFLQPGRFLQPGSTPDDGLFFPVARLDKPKRGSNGAALVARYEAYRRLVRTFYATVFGRLRRQVVLIDVLTALQQGKESFSDLALAVRTIAQSFDDLAPAYLKLLPFTGVDRLALVATKADHVTTDQVRNLAGLLQDMTGALLAGADGFQAIASVRATSEVWNMVDGTSLPFLVGVPAGGTMPKKFHVGVLPGAIPAADGWANVGFRIRTFEPPTIPPGAPLPHLNMDKLLQFLLAP